MMLRDGETYRVRVALLPGRTAKLSAETFRLFVKKSREKREKDVYPRRARTCSNDTVRASYANDDDDDDEH